MATKPLKPGDVLLTALEDGRFGAVRILRRIGASSLVATTPYIGATPPAMTDPLLKKTLRSKRFVTKNKPELTWRDGKPHPKTVLLGNIPPTKKESTLECGSYGGKWFPRVGQEVLWEWRWEHDRAGLEEEVRREDEANTLPAPRRKPKKMMPEPKFWKIIGLLNWKKLGDDDDVLGPAVKALAAMTVADIRQFEERLASLLYTLDTHAHATNLGKDSYKGDGKHFSVDNFLYVRCCVVANGKKMYETILNNPKKMPKGVDFEPLLTLASAAYERKTGKDFDYTPGCDYEAFSNREGWAGARNGGDTASGV
ncbi:MAG: DUF4240 domain-containing protein [Phycisphaerales bacterium]